MRGPIIVGAVLFGVVLLQAYWPQLNDLIDRWHDWRQDREFQKRHTEAGRNE